MRVSDFLPFISHARLVNSRYERVKVSSLTHPRGLSMPEGIPEGQAVEYFRKRAIPVYVPTDSLLFRVPDLSNMEYRFLSNLPEDMEVLVKVQEVDYLPVVQALDFDSKTGAYYDLAGVSDFEELGPGYPEALTEASSGDYSSLIPLILSSRIRAQESLSEALPRGARNVAQRLPIDKIERLITNYVTSREGSERVPVLFGNTAVAKSALVKSVTKKLGLRMVDFRCAFLDKQDIEGFRHKIRSEEGDLFSTTAPPEKILQCTDDFLDYCQATAQELKLKLAEINDPKQKQATLRVIENLEFMAKPPILFFDEVTRASRSVQNAFVQVLNQKSFRGMAMKRARVVAASNYPIDMPEEYVATYLTEDLDDAGVKERYEPVIVRPRDVGPRWMSYVETDGDFDPVLVEFLREDPDRQYNIQVVQDVVDAANLPPDRQRAEPDPLVQSEMDVGIVPFPNFRTWEFVNDHLVAVRAGKTRFNETLVFGYIGKNYISQELVKRVREKIPEAAEKPEGKDFLSESIDAAYHTGAPILLLGMTSIGKTSRIKMLEAKYHAKVVAVNLAQKDRVDVQGAPASIPVHESLAMREKDDLPTSVLAIMEKNVSTRLPNSPRLTRTLPDFYLRSEIEEAKKLGKKVVLFFDELNRADPNTMSAVLEAVSDQRFGGVVFPWLCTDPGHKDENGMPWSAPRDDLVKRRCPQGHPCEPQVIITAACNYGAEYSEAGLLDPAISGRFSMVRKLEFDETDRAAILEFMRTSTKPKYPEVLIKFIESKPFPDLKEMLSSVESRDVHKAAPSLRALSDMAKTLNQVEDQALQGFLPDQIWEREISQPVSSPEEALKRLESIPSNWAGFLKGSEVTIGDQKYSVAELVKEMKDTARILKQGMETGWTEPGGGLAGGLSQDDVEDTLQDINYFLIQLMYVNQEVHEYRKQEFVSKFGEFYAEDFLTFYNSMAGVSILDITDVRDEKLAWEYAEQLTRSTDDINERIVLYRGYFSDFYNANMGSAPKELYQAVLLSVARAVGANADAFFDVVMAYTQDGYVGVRGFFNRALDPEITLALAKDFGLGSIADAKDDVEAYYASGQAPTGTGGHPPRTQEGS